MNNQIHKYQSNRMKYDIIDTFTNVKRTIPEQVPLYFY